MNPTKGRTARTIKYLCIFTVFLLFSACSTPPVEKKTLRIAVQTSPTTLDPRKSADFVSSTLASLLFEGLTRCKENDAIEPGVAERWEISSDQTVYTFFLRPCTWSDGSPVTAEDFVRSWRKVLDPLFASPSSYLLYPIKNGEKFAKGEAREEDIGICALDPHTLEVRLEKPTPHFLSLTAFPLLVAAPPCMEKGREPLLSNGPFVLAREKPHASLSLQKNPLYWNRSAVDLEGVEIEIMPSEWTALHLFQKGELDWIGAPLMALSLDALEALGGDPTLSFHEAAASTFCAFNTQKAPFDCLPLRKAFALAIDRTQILAAPGAQIADRVLPPCFLKGLPLYHFDEAGAQDALQEARLLLGELPPVTLLFRSGPAEKRLAQLLQAEWKKHLGIEVFLQQVDAKTHAERLQQGAHQIALASWIAQYHDPLNLLERFQSLHAKNPSRWISSSYQLLLEKIADLPLGSQRDDAVREAEALLAQELPLLPLYHWKNPSLTQERVAFLPYTSNGGILFEKAVLRETP